MFSRKAVAYQSEALLCGELPTLPAIIRLD
jgi:hypothetical protein